MSTSVPERHPRAELAEDRPRVEPRAVLERKRTPASTMLANPHLQSSSYTRMRTLSRTKVSSPSMYLALRRILAPSPPHRAASGAHVPTEPHQPTAEERQAIELRRVARRRRRWWWRWTRRRARRRPILRLAHRREALRTGHVCAHIPRASHHVGHAAE